MPEPVMRENLRQIIGNDSYFNSGVGSGLTPEQRRGGVAYRQLINDSGIFRIGNDLSATNLWLPPGSLEQYPHFHPGGEFTVVLEGGFEDYDMDGRVVQAYKRGDVVFSNIGSSHRPGSKEGGWLVYLSPDSLVMSRDPEKLIHKMVGKRMPQEAINWALQWIFKDEADRTRILEDIAKVG